MSRWTERVRRSRKDRGATRPALPPRVVLLDGRTDTAVDRYWTAHTVNSRPFATAEASADYLEWRFAEYPLFRELSGLWGEDMNTDNLLCLGMNPHLDYALGPSQDHGLGDVRERDRAAGTRPEPPHLLVLRPTDTRELRVSENCIRDHVVVNAVLRAL